jgi:hypothetical protein
MCFELSNQKTNNYAQITKNKQLKNKTMFGEIETIENSEFNNIGALL